ncbi:Leucine-rich repeat serine/threonine-protein kinase 2 [Hondaea fermentalgiana]|uniref:non-specific serine/threonine protein kinase n=1 Tax=Hondaea fermentalgiana TaxID=2315210 RepID=A0A2R5GTW4_9STRA|nr:Leucine-rich repeat serine/threonine-protein kinase 2 [Hondaea fermentalgiana]|eukprot:GBG34317.1 Leucine-rich repeat serine/threonine-protein kinase 2 [Hondaea fermentalgiana]
MSSRKEQAIANAIKAMAESEEELRLESNGIGDCGALALAQALNENTSLQTLYIHRNKIGPNGVFALADALMKTSSLQTLALDNNGIGDMGISSLANALAENASLRTLSLYGNRIGDAGANALAAALESNDILQELRYVEATSNNPLRMRHSNMINSLDREYISADILARIESRVKLVKNELDDLKVVALEALKANEKVRWGRAKLMVVGKGAAGKTSTIRTLLNQPFNPDHDSTIGVDLRLMRTRDWRERRTITDADLGEQFAKFKYRQQSNVQRVSNRMPAGMTQLPSSHESSALRRAPMLFDEEEVVKAVSTPLRLQVKNQTAKTDEEVSFTIWDYGGQEVFYALHHLFLTQYGVYVLVFDMREVLGKEHFQDILEKDDLEKLASQEQALETLRFWIDSIHLHAPNAHIALVGTYLDQVPNTAEHEAIEEVLEDRVLSARGVMSAVVLNNEAELNFFPIDNTDRSNLDERVSRLREALTETVASKDFVTDKVPLRWSFCLEQLLSQNEDYLSLEAVQKIAENECYVPKEDVDKMLKYMHELGVLVHLTTGQNDVLRKYVVIRPQWLLKNLSRVICDPKMNHMKKHKKKLLHREKLPRNLRDPLNDWSNRGVASRELLEWLWQGQPIDYLTALMDSMLLACPSPWIGDYEKLDKEGALLVPSLLQPVEEAVKKKVLEHSRREFALAYIEFTVLPKGVFQRFIASLIQSFPALVGVREPGVFSDFASLVFDNVGMILETSGNRVMLYFAKTGHGCLANHVKILKNSLESINLSFMKGNLGPRLFISSNGTGTKDACASVDALVNATGGEVSSLQQGLRLPLASFAPFVESRTMAMRLQNTVTSRPSTKPFQVFMSHAWGKGNAAHEKVMAVADALKARGITYWLDEYDMGSETLISMANGIDQSRVFLVFVTRTYMEKVNKERTELDNCRNEFLYALQRVKPANMIPCVMDSTMMDMSKWEGRFGISWSGAPMYVPMLSAGRSKAEMDKLEKVIRRVLCSQEEATQSQEVATATPAGLSSVEEPNRK